MFSPSTAAVSTAEPAAKSNDGPVHLTRVPLQALERDWDADVRNKADRGLLETVLQIAREMARWRTPHVALDNGADAAARDEALYLIKRCDAESFYTVSVLYPHGTLFTKHRLNALETLLPMFVTPEHIEWGTDAGEDHRPYLNVRVRFAENPVAFEARYLLMTTSTSAIGSVVQQPPTLVPGSGDAGGVRVQKIQKGTLVSNNTGGTSSAVRAGDRDSNFSFSFGGSNKRARVESSSTSMF